MLFVQPKNKEPDTVVKDIVDSVALDSEVRISKANQYYLTNVKLYSQCKHLIAGLLEANYKINPEIGKEEQFKEFAATKPVVLTVEESILQVKISGDTNMFEHILEAEPINAEKEPYTFPGNQSSSSAIFFKSLRTASSLGCFFGWPCTYTRSAIQVACPCVMSP